MCETSEKLSKTKETSSDILYYSTKSPDTQKCLIYPDTWQRKVENCLMGEAGIRLLEKLS